MFLLFEQASATTDEVSDLINKAKALANSSKYEEAITYYDKVLAIEPNNTDALAVKVVALAELGKFGEAITSLDKILAIEPNNTKVLELKEKLLSELRK